MPFGGKIPKFNGVNYQVLVQDIFLVLYVALEEPPETEMIPGVIWFDVDKLRIDSSSFIHLNSAS